MWYINSKHFQNTLSFHGNGKKTYEVRKLDRPFHVGDKVLLEEYSPDFGYFGRAIMGNIVNIFVDPEYVKSGMGILQLDNMQNGYRGVSE